MATDRRQIGYKMQQETPAPQQQYSHYIPFTGDNMKSILGRSKADIIKQFELICQTDRSFTRAKKNVHNIFDELYKKLLNME